jgi:hypothetical protein
VVASFPILHYPGSTQLPLSGFVLVTALVTLASLGYVEALPAYPHTVNVSFPALRAWMRYVATTTLQVNRS